MKALLLEKYGEPRICEVSCPIIADDEVLVRVHACAICGSDVHGYDGRSDRRRPPIIMGHEAAGEVAQVGNQVKDTARVTVWSSILPCFAEPVPIVIMAGRTL